MSIKFFLVVLIIIWINFYFYYNIIKCKKCYYNIRIRISKKNNKIINKKLDI